MVRAKSRVVYFVDLDIMSSQRCSGRVLKRESFFNDDLAIDKYDGEIAVP